MYANFFVTGCGGYIYGNGSVSSPNYLSNHDNDLDECFWFVEAGQLDGVIFAKRNHVPPMFELHTTTFYSRPPTDIPIVTVWHIVYLDLNVFCSYLIIFLRSTTVGTQQVKCCTMNWIHLNQLRSKVSSIPSVRK